MTQLQQSKKRTIVGLGLAIFAAPITTALCVIIENLFTSSITLTNVFDTIGGGLTFMLLATIFGWVFSIVPVIIAGSIGVTIARCIGTSSPAFYLAIGLLAGLIMAWIDARRSHSGFHMLEAIPFLVGGCSSALTYWWVAERRSTG